jgi:hypothetical protein
MAEIIGNGQSGADEKVHAIEGKITSTQLEDSFGLVLGKKLFHVRDGPGYPIRWKAGKEGLAISL